MRQHGGILCAKRKVDCSKMAIPNVLRNNFVLIAFSTLFGAVITFIISKLTNKTARLRYSRVVERIALAADDVIFGSVRITWGDGNSMRNLYLATVEVENESSHDFENIDLKVYCAPDTLLLGERTSIPNSPYIVKWSPTFRASLATPEGETLSQKQWETYHSTREYEVPVFNRGQLLHLSYLCTRPNDDRIPEVFVSTQLKGARLFHQRRRNFIHGVPMQIALTHGLVIALLVLALCCYFLRNVPVASIVCMMVGLFAQSLGAGEYKLRKWFWRLLAG